MPQGKPSFSVEEAVTSLRRIEGLEPLLRIRAEGLTTMLWGLITAGIFFSYQVVHSSAGHEGNRWLGLLWVPWVLAGVAATRVLWRTLRLPHQDDTSLRTGIARAAPFAAIFLVVYAGALLAYFVIGDLGRLHEPGYMTLVLATVAFGLAASPVPRSARSTRLVHLATGVVAVVAALGVAYVIRPAGEDASFLAQTLVGAFSVGGAWFVGGLLQASKR